MRGAWRSLRVQLAAAGFVAIYAPVLVLFGVVVVTEDETATVVDGVEVTETTSSGASPWAAATVVALCPAAAVLAWGWAGRALRPIEGVRAVAEDVEATDLGRRIGDARGPTEVVRLAASFDAMLDRLQLAADEQRRLVEEASHELRTPLAVLAANAEVLLAHPAPSVDVYREGLERARAAAARLQATIDELLVGARGRARTIDRRPVDVVALARAVVDDARLLAAAKDVQVSCTGPPALVGAVDATTVRRAVANLVDNAVRHAPAGSTVEVELAATTTEVRVSVTDHGPGIPAEAQADVFERFWRGTPQPETPGSGLGLPIARQVAHAHGGDVTVTSPGPAGDGCVFVLRLRR